MSDVKKRCAACRKEKPVSEMKVCMHSQMHYYVCDAKCMHDFYNPPKAKKPDHDAAIAALQSRLDAAEAERDQLRAETETLKTAVEFNRAPDDAEFGPGHPVFELAAENDRLRAERDSHQRLCIAEMENNSQLRAENTDIRLQCGGMQMEIHELRAELEAIRGQQPDAGSVPRELLESHLTQIGEYGWWADSVDQLRALLSTKNAEESQPCDK